MSDENFENVRISLAKEPWLIITSHEAPWERKCMYVSYAHAHQLRFWKIIRNTDVTNITFMS